MERLSNEKIMAIQEYSDTVLSQINRNHEEAVFLYDMLNNKHTQVKNTVAEINKKMQSVTDPEHTTQEQPAVAKKEIMTEDIGMEMSADGAMKKNQDVAVAEEEKTKAKRTATKRKTPAKKTIAKKSNVDIKVPEAEEQIIPDSDNGNNKSKILKLHEEGKSNIDIAKSLGMGMGEVKLIIDLYESGE